MSANSQPVTTALPFPKTAERLLNSREVAEWLGVSIDWVQAHATRRNPRIPSVCLGTGPTGRQMLRFRRADIESFIADHVEGSPSLRRRA
jgi:predicted DNA-binding transcriptional regulator AlpA